MTSPMKHKKDGRKVFGKKNVFGNRKSDICKAIITSKFFKINIVELDEGYLKGTVKKYINCTYSMLLFNA